MRNRIPFSGAILRMLVLVAMFVAYSDILWAMSPRYERFDAGRVLEVDAANLMTVRLHKTGRTIQVRLLGVGSPKHYKLIKRLGAGFARRMREHRAWEVAREYVAGWLCGRSVELWTRKWNRFDSKKRLLVYLKTANFLDELVDVNGEIIRKGMGFVTRDYVHVMYARYRRLEDDAMLHGRGLWQALSLDRLSSLTH